MEDRRRLQWSSLRDDIRQWRLYGAICSAKSSSSFRNSNLCGRSHKICIGYRDSRATGFCNGFTHNGNASHGQQTAVCGNNHRLIEYNGVLERCRQWLQWCVLRDDIREWTLYRTIHSADSSSGVCDSNICGGSHKISYGFRNDPSADLCLSITIDGSDLHRSSSAVHGNSNRHFEQCGVMERRWQRLRWNKLRHDIDDRTLYRAKHRSRSESSHSHCNLGCRQQ
jgi:hypothetical protein